jgi:hypothetical protein
MIERAAAFSPRPVLHTPFLIPVVLLNRNLALESFSQENVKKLRKVLGANYFGRRY